MVDTIQTRLGRIYLEALACDGDDDDDVTTDDVEALQDEVESLYSEILPVAQMTVEQQHLDPALSSVAKHGGISLEQTAAAMDYVWRFNHAILSRS